MIIVVVTIGTLWLAYVWVNSFVESPDKVGELLSKIWDLALVSLATLFIHGLWPKN